MYSLISRPRPVEEGTCGAISKGTARLDYQDLGFAGCLPVVSQRGRRLHLPLVPKWVLYKKELRPDLRKQSKRGRQMDLKFRKGQNESISMVKLQSQTTPPENHRSEPGSVRSAYYRGDSWGVVDQLG
ncbi:hypothetical protein QYF36_019929 [Acer negundo]|nr:hypothetical protein QYF36_019929 [Acer negundo]